ncbi:MAG: polynucleotide kinase-phosphatase [Myxococcota bacterium]
MTTITIPELSLVLLIGPSGSGKSTFAERHFRASECLSSDAFRGLVADDENDQSASSDAFDALRYVAEKRLRRGHLTVVDATNVQPEARKPFLALAKETHVLPVAIVLQLPPKTCQARNALRPDRAFGAHVIRRQHAQLKRSLRSLKREGFRRITVLTSVEEIRSVKVERQPLWNDRRTDEGPFDIIGDVHGCARELRTLLGALGYREAMRDGAPTFAHPTRRAFFVGDLVDRGPDSPGVLAIVMAMVRAGAALAVPGNHEVKLHRKLSGRNVTLSHGLAETMAQLDACSEQFREDVRAFIDGLVSHYVLDHGKLVVAHAGLREELQGRASGAVRSFALYGETSGETDEFGLPVRHDWAADYRGRALVVYGHTPSPEAEFVNGTICIDTGCVFGGKLTALRYPERELVSVPAAREYYPPTRPLSPPRNPEPRPAGAVDLEDVVGKRRIETRLGGAITIGEAYAAAALEPMSRFAVDPRWLVYLPPTMSPSEASSEPGYLEHPEQALDYYRRQGIEDVICEEKHMGSRAVFIVCRSPDAVRERFGIDATHAGTVYTRTGRPFFRDAGTEAAVLDRIRNAATRAGMFSALDSDWVCLDAELMPWSAKAAELIESQYAPVGAAGRTGLARALEGLGQCAAYNPEARDLQQRFEQRLDHLQQYSAAYRPYCWPIESIDDYRVAPFHVLASEGQVHTDKDHLWHLDWARRLAAEDGVMAATEARTIELSDPHASRDATEFWERITGRGGEGMVVKPRDFARASVQPALKSRGPEYLRLIYGPEYRTEGQLDRLRKRSVGKKRRLAKQEYCLGLEALHRFVEREPLYRVHECVFGVLALESEPTDPRL